MGINFNRKPKTIEDYKRWYKWQNIITILMWVLILILIIAYKKDISSYTEALKFCQEACKPLF